MSEKRDYRRWTDYEVELLKEAAQKKSWIDLKGIAHDTAPLLEREFGSVYSKLVLLSQKKSKQTEEVTEEKEETKKDATMVESIDLLLDQMQQQIDILEIQKELLWELRKEADTLESWVADTLKLKSKLVKVESNGYVKSIEEK